MDKKKMNEWKLVCGIYPQFSTVTLLLIYVTRLLKKKKDIPAILTTGDAEWFTESLNSWTLDY